MRWWRLPNKVFTRRGLFSVDSDERIALSFSVVCLASNWLFPVKGQKECQGVSKFSPSDSGSAKSTGDSSLLLSFWTGLYSQHDFYSFVLPVFRVLGSLLSAHRIITDSKQPFGDMTIKDYDNELLHMAHDLAVRLLPAFENTKTGIPYPRVGGRFP